MWFWSRWCLVSDSIREGFVTITTSFISIIVETVIVRCYELDCRCFKSFTIVFGSKCVGLRSIIIINVPTFSLIFNFVGFDVWNFSKFKRITCCYGIANFGICKMFPLFKTYVCSSFFGIIYH